jgi:hypothetical protein
MKSFKATKWTLSVMILIILLGCKICQYGLTQEHLPLKTREMIERICRIAKIRQWGVKRARHHITDLIKILKEESDPSVQCAAVLALGRLEANEALKTLKELEQKLEEKAWTRGLRDFKLFIKIKASIVRIEFLKFNCDPNQIVNLFLKRFKVDISELNYGVIEEIKARKFDFEYILILRHLADLIATMRQKGYEESILNKIEKQFRFDLDYPCKLRIELSKIPDKQKRVKLLLYRLLTATSGTMERMCDAQALADEDDNGEVIRIVSEYLENYHKIRNQIKEYWRIDLLLRVLGAIGNPKALYIVQKFLNDPNEFVRMSAKKIFEALQRDKPFPIGSYYE